MGLFNKSIMISSPSYRYRMTTPACMPSPATAIYAGQQLFLVEGTLDSLYNVEGIALRIALHRLYGRAEAADLCAAVRGLRQAHETAAIGADDSEERADVLIARLGGALAYGRFAHACELAEGERVRAVVARSGAHLLLHSLIRQRDDLLLLPPCARSTTQARVRRHRRSVRCAIGGIWIAAALLVATQGPLTASHWPGFGLLLSAVALAAVLTALVMRFNAEPAESMEGGDHAQAIFTVYGFPLPDYFDAATGMTFFEGRASDVFAPSAAIALHKHKKTFNLFC